MFWITAIASSSPAATMNEIANIRRRLKSGISRGATSMPTASPVKTQPTSRP